MPITPYKRQWQAIRGMWGKRAAKVLEEPFIGDSSLVGKPFVADSLVRKPFIGDSLVGKPFTFSDLNCFYPWCQVIYFVHILFLYHSPLRVGRQSEEEHTREPFLICE